MQRSCCHVRTDRDSGPEVQTGREDGNDSADMTTAELASFIGYSRQSVYNFLSTGNWNRFMAAELMEKLEIRMEDLEDD